MTTAPTPVTIKVSRCLADHKLLIAIRALWEMLPLVGEYHDRYGSHLEMRNCTCGSTISRPLPGHIED